MQSQPPATPAPSAANPGLFIVAMRLVGLNLRAPFISVAPIASQIRTDLGITAAEVGLMTSLPVLCFGLAAPLALVVVRRAGAEIAVLVCLFGIIAGSVLRSAGPFWMALASTLLMGLSITIGNIVIPVLIRRDVSSPQVGLATGAYVSMLNIGAVIVSIGTAPLAQILGWRLALAAWTALAVIAVVGWLIFLRRSSDQQRIPEPPPATAPVAVYRNPLAWLIGLAFAGQATSYYSVTAWLPTLLADERGLSAATAGVSSSVFQLCAVAGALATPLLAARLNGWRTMAVLGALWVSLPIGLLLAPEQFILFSVLGGVAQGGGFTAIFTVVAQVSRTGRESSALSAFVQGVGYVIAAIGPPVLGLVHDASDGWTVPMLIVVGTTLVFSVLGIPAALRASALAREASMERDAG
jgi:CP family cyanate transporter-like MFS transporter